MTSHATFLPKLESTLAFPRSRSALLVIDPVNDFLSEGGAAWELTGATVQFNDVVFNLRRAIAAARGSGLMVLFGPMAYTETDYAHEHLQRRSGINRMMFERRMFLAGSWGADFHPQLQPHQDDVVLQPHKSCDVFQTDLGEHLQRNGITHLVIAGMTANLCCESTGRHAMEAGYDVSFLSDAMGATSIAEYEAAIRLDLPLIANAVITVDEFLAALDQPATAGISAQPGDTVRGSDHGEIGTVERVVGPDEASDGYLVVPVGLVFKRDSFIPLDAVVKQSGRDLFINVPKLMVTRMPWGSPPTRDLQRDKRGPRAVDVAQLYGSRGPSAPT
jgi:ureidoacrylate peracid hydrolase